MLSREQKYGLLIGIVIAAIAALLLVDPISQDLSYHHFADIRPLFGIPNIANVVSNILFLIVGAWGLVSVGRSRFSNGFSSLKKAHLTLYLGIFLTGFGSAYYHWDPTNATLVWDRLPMAVAFMALFAIMIGEQISEELALKLFGPLIVFGIFSIAYWYFTEQKDLGDLRIYLLVQFLPILLIPLLLLLFSSPFNSTKPIWIALLCYGLAKACELSDETVYSLGQGVSGHSIKHLMAALGAGSLLWGFKTRHLKKSK